MSEKDLETAETVVSPEEALNSLKARADLLGIKYKSNIGVEALKTKIEEHLAPKEDEAPLSRTEQMAAVRREAREKALRLVRVRITCMNPSKKDLHGEIFTVANRYIGNITKFVPFNDESEGGYHVPQALLNVIKARKFLDIRTRANRNNSADIKVSTKFVPEFAIEELPQLTEEELNELKAAQAAKGGVA